MTWMECKRKDSNTIVSARSASTYVCVIGEEIVPAEAVGSHFELRLRRVFTATAELQRSNAHNPTNAEAARRSDNRKRRNRTCCNNNELIIRLYYTSIQSYDIMKNVLYRTTHPSLSHNAPSAEEAHRVRDVTRREDKLPSAVRLRDEKERKTAEKLR